MSYNPLILPSTGHAGYLVDAKLHTGDPRRSTCLGIWSSEGPFKCGTRGLLDEPTKLTTSLSSEIPLGFQTRNNTPSEEKLGKDYSL